MEQPLSHQVSPQKSQTKPQNRNYKMNTVDNPRKILLSPETSGKIIYTEPSYSCYENRKIGRKSILTNKIYSLDDEIKAHAKAILDQNFSTAFTPNSKQTEEDFESQDIWEGKSYGKSSNNEQNNKEFFVNDHKLMTFMDSDAICQITEISKNVKYVNGGVGIIDQQKDFRGFLEEKDGTSFVGITLEENPKKNQIKSPFSPMLLIHTNNSQKTQTNPVFLNFLKELVKKSS